jgi:hypothetical protein
MTLQTFERKLLDIEKVEINISYNVPDYKYNIKED